MPALAKIQRDFCQYIKGHGHKDFCQHIKLNNASKEDSLAIHRQNIFLTHTEALENNFPLVFSIMGDVAARPMAHAYIEANFPCTGVSRDWGAGFPAFIQSYEQSGDWPYLTEVAHYERAKYVAYCASEDPLFTVEERDSLMVFDQKEQTFQFQKSCQLIAFLHPLEQIISSYQQGQDSSISKTQGSSYALIFKHQGAVKVCWITPSLFVFMNRLKEGQGIDVAFAAAKVLETDFDVDQAFKFILSYPLVCKIEKNS